MIENIEALRNQFTFPVTFRERRPNLLQIELPIFHEDGDLIDIFLTPLSSENQIRITDAGSTLMRLSYEYEIDSENKRRIFNQILDENKIEHSEGVLFVDSKLEHLYANALGFAQTLAKVGSMRLFKREVIESLFYEQLNDFVYRQLLDFDPRVGHTPISNRDDLDPDFAFMKPRYPVYLFGVNDSRQATVAALAFREFQLKKIIYRGAIVYQDMEKMSRKDITRLTQAADKQFPSLEAFQQDAEEYLARAA